MSQIRVEYLFTNIQSEKQLELLRNEKLFSPYEDEISDLSFIPDQVLLNLHSEVKWSNETVHDLATFLIDNPLMLPYFLENSAIDIVGLFLGKYNLFVSMFYPRYPHPSPAPFMAFGGDSKCDFWSGKRAEISQENHDEAKYKLSLFLGVIDELLERGINLLEFSFFDLTKMSNFNESKKVSMWNKELISTMKELIRTMDVRAYRRLDAIFTEERILSYIDFKDLNGFLQSIINIVDTDCFIEKPVIMNPKKVIDIPNRMCLYWNQDFIPKYKLVKIKPLCKKLQMKLKKVAMDAEIMILKRKLAKLSEILMTKEEGLEYDYSEVIDEIELLYKELSNLNSSHKKELLAALKQIIEDSHLNISLGSTKSSKITTNFTSRADKKKPFKKGTNKSEERMGKTFDKRVNELEKRMEKLEKKVTSLEEELITYIKEGRVMPSTAFSTNSKEEIIKLIREYRPNTFGEKLRKFMVLDTLKAGVLGAILGGVLFTTSAPKSLTTLDTTPFLNLEYSLLDEEPKTTLSEGSSFDKKDLLIKETQKTIEQNTELSLKSLEEIVMEIVIYGKWGDGEIRRKALEEAGYDYITIQTYVTYVMNYNIPFNALRPKEEIIKEIADGKWGENEELIERLKAVGYDYSILKPFVDELKQSNDTISNQFIIRPN